LRCKQDDATIWIHGDREVEVELERSVEVSLTPTGEELKNRASVIPQLVVDAYDLDADDFTALRNTLRELTESVTATTPGIANS
jgi:hypothetical protein